MIKRTAVHAIGTALTILCFLAVVPESAEGLPLYAARSVRTCDNCHALPNEWPNPDVWSRKCNLSCVNCHIDPSGGGMRNVVGRYYAESTLPMFRAAHRGYKDRDRLTGDPGGARVHRTPELAWGSPVGERAEMAYIDRRYFGLNADPLLQVGVDARLAAWVSSGSATVFPMQLDTHAAVHPLPHLTVHTTAGVLAKAKGVGATLERETVFAVKDAAIMVHQLPGMFYGRVGRFVPAFGTRLADHTSYVRREFELDLGSQHSRVVGAEVGLSPNYPYAQLSVFRPNQADLLDERDPFNDLDAPWLGVDGWGMAANTGWRDFIYSVGASYMMKRRELMEGGDTESGSIHGALNLWAIDDSIPLTWLAEFALGRRQRQLSGLSTLHNAAFVELDWLALNGLNIRFKYDFVDPDIEVSDDHVNRIGAGFDFHPVPNVTLTGQARMGITSSGSGEPPVDFIFFARGWL